MFDSKKQLEKETDISIYPFTGHKSEIIILRTHPRFPSSIPGIAWGPGIASCTDGGGKYLHQMVDID